MARWVISFGELRTDLDHPVQDSFSLVQAILSHQVNGASEPGGRGLGGGAEPDRPERVLRQPANVSVVVLEQAGDGPGVFHVAGQREAEQGKPYTASSSSANNSSRSTMLGHCRCT